MSASDELELLVRSCAAEGEEHLAAMEAGLLFLERGGFHVETVNEVFRAAHTLKGNAAVCDFVAVAELAHTVESQLELLRDRKIPVSAGIITMLLRSVDALRDLMAKAAGDALGGPISTVAQPTVVARTLRVDVRKLDQMLDAVGEIGIARARVTRRMEELGEPAAEALDLMRDAARLHLELQELILGARMVPLGEVLGVLARVARDVAAREGKEVELLVIGGDVEVDTRIVDQLRDPLAHLLRNAIAHGIERPEARIAAGKPSCGTITVRARHASGGVLVEMADDGAGLDRAEILARARERGLVSADEEPGAAKLDRLIFEAGFSTASSVTDVSGRGVGMDVVRRRVEAIGGDVEIQSERGAGTTVTLRVPLTVAIIEGFSFAVGGDVYVVPLPTVVECLEMPSAGAVDVEGMIAWRGAALPCIRLRRLFAVASAGPTRNESLVVVRHEGQRVGLVVDELLGTGEAVIRSLGPLFQGTPGVAASTLGADGRVSLILDVASMIRNRTAFLPSVV